MKAESQTFESKAAWLAGRRHGIGASEAAAVIGANPWKSALQLYAEKLELVEPDALETEAMEWGLLLEAPIAQQYERVIGRTVARPTPWTLHRSRQHPWMTATVDGFVEDPQRGPGILQIKTAGLHRTEEWTEEPPLHYQIQVQHEIHVAGVTWGALAVLLGGQRLLSFDLDRNDSFLELLIAREREFWERLLRQEPPAPDASEASREVLRRLYPREQAGLSVPLPVAAVEWDAQRLEAASQLEHWKAVKDEAENRLKAAIGEAECGVLPDGTAYLWKERSRKGYTVEAGTYRELRRKAPK
ncbi:MAG: YqaJ viral recombinase family protein [Candidatus Rokubacteria bacterium]|nr:YqaJ viral recombinase family protein [Candidatus Rokubacteria bacterium]